MTIYSTTVLDMPLSRTELICGGLWCAGETVRNLWSEGHRALGEINVANLTGDGGRNVVVLVGLGVLRLVDSAISIDGLFIVHAVSAAVLTLVCVHRERFRTMSFAWTSLGGPRTAYLRSAAILWGPAILAVVLSSGDVWAVGQFNSATIAGEYAAAARLAALVIVPLFVVNATFLPSLASSLVAGRVNHAQGIARDAATLAAAASLLAVVGLVVLGPEVCSDLLGVEVGAQWTPVLVLSLSHVINAASGPVGVALIAAGGERELAWASVASAVVSGISLLLLGSGGSTVLVAVGVAFNQVMYNLATGILLFRRARIFCFVDLANVRGIVSRLRT